MPAISWTHAARVVKVLDGQPHETLRLTGPAILVAEELYPTDIVTLDRSLVLGFITSCGFPQCPRGHHRPHHGHPRRGDGGARSAGGL